MTPVRLEPEALQSRVKHSTSIRFVDILVFMSGWNFMLSSVEHEKKFITLGPGVDCNSCKC